MPTETTTKTITVTKRDGSTKSVESPYTTSEVFQNLIHYVSEGKIRGEFARDLAYRSRKYAPSEKQIAWAHIIVVEHETPRQQAAATASLPRLRAMVDKAAETLRYPKVDFTTEGGARIRLRRAGQNAQHPGSIAVTDGRPYGENTYYGLIGIDGVLWPSSRMTDEVTAFLTDFDSDPEAAATAHGLRTGACCFCARILTDGRSVAQGYGPICAGKFGLPWGADRAASTVEVK